MIKIHAVNGKKLKKLNDKLTLDDIKKKVMEAEQYAEEDLRKKEEIDTLNKADSMVLSTERTLEELGDKVTDDQKKPILDGIEKLKASMEAKDIPQVKADMEAVEKLFHEISKVMYEQASAQQGQEGQQVPPDMGGQQAPPPKGDGGSDNVVDGDYEVVD